MSSKNFYMVLVMSLIWGTSFPFSHVIIESIGPYAFRVVSSVVSLLLMFIFFLKPIVKSIRQLNKRECYNLFILAVPNFFLVPTLNSISLKYTSITSATILIYTMPCFTSFFMMIIDRKISVLSSLAMLMCTIGIVFTLNAINIGIGEIIILISAVCWSGASILSQKVQSTVSFKAKLFWQMFIATVLMVAVYPIFQTGDLITPLTDAFSSVKLVSLIFYFSLASNVLVSYIWFLLIQDESAEYASYGALLSPVITVLFASLFFDEIPTIKQTLGFSLVLLSAIVVNILRPLFKKKNWAIT